MQVLAKSICRFTLNSHSNLSVGCRENNSLEELDEKNYNNEVLSEKIKNYEDMRIKNMNNKGNNKNKKL